MYGGTLGEIRIFAGHFEPRQWRFCRGQELYIANNQALYSLIGIHYGGDGRNTFALPNLQGRKAIPPPQQGTFKYMPQYIGYVGGDEKYKLEENELPIHSHLISGGTITGTAEVPCDNNNGNTEEPDSGFFATSPTREVFSNIANTELAPINVPHGTFNYTLPPGADEKNTPIDLRDPYLTLNYVICVEGDYPSFS